MSVYRPTYRDPKTGETKQAAVWWCEFSFAGRRYRESTKTTRKTLAVEYEKRRRLQFETHNATGKSIQSTSRMLTTVKAAVKAYRDAYDCPNHRAKSIAWVKERLVHVERLLGGLALVDLTADQVRGYMRKRRDEGVGNRTINMELDCLARAAGRTWKQLWPDVGPLDEPCDVGHALSPDEEGRLLGASARDRSRFIQPFIRIALLTGMRCGEIRKLQVRQIDIEKRELRVGHAKTPSGEGRGIPVNNPDLFSTVSEQIAKLERDFGPVQPDWYLFPFSNRGKPVDPKRPVTTVKTSWESVRAAAGVECRLHDLRHTAATKMSENGTPEGTMKALLGHMSAKMLERYSHIRMDAKRTATAALSLATPVFEIPKVSPKVEGNRRLKVVRKA